MSELQVNEDCIGCESCIEVCPEVFELDTESGHAKVKDPNATGPCVDEAMEICPVQAIVRE